MSLSEHEKTQFELLTADLVFDNTDLKMMAKRERATAMSYFNLPRVSARFSDEITMNLAILGLAAIFFAVLFVLVNLPLAAAVFGTICMVAWWGAYMRLTLGFRKKEQDKRDRL
jgi:hypothetical protein